MTNHILSSLLPQSLQVAQETSQQRTITEKNIHLFDCNSANISALYDRYNKYQCIIAGDFNTNLDASDPVAVLIKNFLSDYSLIRCDDIFPSRKSATYINESLGHKSCIDYVLVSDVQKTIDFAVCAPD